ITVAPVVANLSFRHSRKSARANELSVRPLDRGVGLVADRFLVILGVDLGPTKLGEILALRSNVNQASILDSDFRMGLPIVCGEHKIELPRTEISNSQPSLIRTMATVTRNIRTTLEMIKIEHTLFALPFAFLGAVLAALGVPTVWQIIWITIAMVGARSTAMAFNRIADKDYDARNPRTKIRAIPAGALSVAFVWGFTLLSAAIFFLAAAMLNRLTLLLSPVALASVVLYSYTKRWTLLSHLVLGWCLGIAPAGAWIAVRGAIDSPIPLLLSLIVMLWTAGFDVLYACQDYDFDWREG